MKLPESYTVKQLADLLKHMGALYGDLPVVLKDPDTGERMAIGVVLREAKGDDPQRIEVRADYHGRPDGAADWLDWCTRCATNTLWRTPPACRVCGNPVRWQPTTDRLNDHGGPDVDRTPWGTPLKPGQ